MGMQSGRNNRIILVSWIIPLCIVLLLQACIVGDNIDYSPLNIYNITLILFIIYKSYEYFGIYIIEVISPLYHI